MHAALSEAGYPEAEVEPHGHFDDGTPWVRIYGMRDTLEKKRASWQAFYLCYPLGRIPCWECWIQGTQTGERCIDGDCSSGVTG